MVNLRKPAKVNLSKGQKICLTKNAEKTGSEIEFAFIGANWSQTRDGRNVDLDSSLLLFDENKKLIEKIYFGNLKSRDNAVKHSGDDRSGDVNTDEFDNEVITINLKKLSGVKYMVSILNNYTHQKFSNIPNVELRIYTNDSGKANDVDNVLCSYKLDNNKEFEDKEAIILGHFYIHNGQWKFSADGIGTKERSIDEIARNSAISVLD